MKIKVLLPAMTIFLCNYYGATNFTKSQFAGSCDEKTIHFLDQTFYFPRNVSTVFKEQGLSFIPPSYFYKTDSSTYELIIKFHKNPGDSDDDRQSKEVLFPRSVHSYIFRVKANDVTYDSLKSNLEICYHSSFKSTKGLKYIPDDLPDRHRKLLEPDRPFESTLMKVDDCLTIGIKPSKSYIFGKSVTVQFIYDLPLGKIGSQMGSY